MPAIRSLGLVYELLRPTKAGSGLPVDAYAEYEPIQTIELIEAATNRLGLRPVRLGVPRNLLENPSSLSQVDAVFNIAEGFGSRNREAWAPVLLEVYGIPCLGSDALTLSTSLDKHWTKLIVEDAGVPTVPGVSVEIGDESYEGKVWRELNPLPSATSLRDRSS